MFSPLSRRSGIWFERVPLDESVAESIPVVISGISPAPTGRIYGGVEDTSSNFRPALLSLLGRRNPVWFESLASAYQAPQAAINGISPAPTGLIQAISYWPVQIQGIAPAPTGLITAVYDPNLLSAVHAVTDESWQEGALQGHSAVEATQPASLLISDGLSHWQAATALQSGSVNVWQGAAFEAGSGLEAWQEGALTVESTDSPWQQAGFVESAGLDHWSAGIPTDHAAVNHWIGAPFLNLSGEDRWQEGESVSTQYSEGFRDGALVLAVEIEVWQQAGLPINASNPGPTIPDPIPLPRSTRLRLICRLPGTRLSLGRVPCVLIPEREIAVRRSYMSINSASLVRWPDLTPLPVTAMSVETDFDSWCWGFSATLAGPEAWALVQPNPLACEVLATINGQQWKFLLDVPSTNRSFNSDQVTLKGRSRSAWLHDPYTPSTNRDESAPREMQQLGEAALLDTGWTLDWQLENWVVPAGRYSSWNTPIGALLRLVQTTDDGLYTDPLLPILTAQKRWPMASWLLDAATVDLSIPESAIISLSQSPVYSLPLNGVYVSGISHGALALVKIAGTDGALQPNDPITHELLCDEEGVSARQRGLNALSDSGAGFTMDAETLFTEEIGLVRPGMVVSIAGMKGVSRSVKISANWSAGLQVVQSIGLERREVEDA